LGRRVNRRGWKDKNCRRPDATVGSEILKVSYSGNVWDGIVGVRGNTRFDGQLCLYYYADVGTDDAGFTYQAWGIKYQLDKFIRRSTLMRNGKRVWGVAASVVVATSLVSTAVSAEGMDGSSNIVCSVVDVVGCAEGGGCAQGSADSFELPNFIIVDAGKKAIRAAYESGYDAVSAVKNMERSGDHLVLHGFENSRGWNLAVDTTTGRMSASGVGDAVSFLVFGACTAL